MTGRAAVGWSAGALVVLAAACAEMACGPKEDVTPQIAVQPGAAARAMALMGRSGPNEKRRSAKDEESDAGDDEESESLESARLVFACVEPLGAIGALGRVPCVATLDAIAPPEAGSDASTASDAASAHVEVVAVDGRVAVAIAPGRYRVTASREPDHVTAQFELDVAAGGTTWGPNEGAVVLARILDTRGYLVADATPHGFGATDARVMAAHALADLASRGSDVLDVWSTNDVDTRARAVADLLARLAAKAPVTAIASGDARTCVRMDDAGQASPWDAKRDADFARGVHERRDVVLTNGPFLRVAANGAGIGGVARAALGTRDVEVTVHVECSAGVTVDRVAILRARGAGTEARVALQEIPRATAGARAADVTLHLRATKDDAFLVVADGSTSAYAMTGAIWIDADGDGESLGRNVDDTPDPLRPTAMKGKVVPTKASPGPGKASPGSGKASPGPGKASPAKVSP